MNDPDIVGFVVGSFIGGGLSLLIGYWIGSRR